MKLHFNLRPIFALFATLLAAGACATTSGGQGEERPGVAIEVDNTGTLAGDLTVYLVSSGLPRRVLGSVPPNRTATLRYNGPVTQGQFRLVARPTAGPEIVSDTFGLSGATGLRWNVQTNLVVPVN